MNRYLPKSDCVNRIERYLAAEGITEYWFGNRGNGHPFVAVAHNRREVLVTFPATTRNFRAPKLAVSKLRRALSRAH